MLQRVTLQAVLPAFWRGTQERLHSSLGDSQFPAQLQALLQVGFRKLRACRMQVQQ